MTDHIANARARHARSGSSEVMQEVGALLNLVDHFQADNRSLHRTVAAQATTIAELRGDLAMLKRPGAARAAAIEECAKVCETVPVEGIVRKGLAAAIRALALPAAHNEEKS